MRLRFQHLLLVAMPLIAWLGFTFSLIQRAANTPAPVSRIYYDESRGCTWSVARRPGFGVLILSSRNIGNVSLNRMGPYEILTNNYSNRDLHRFAKHPLPAPASDLAPSLETRQVRIYRSVGWPLRIITFETLLWQRQPALAPQMTRPEPLGVWALASEIASDDLYRTSVHVRWDPLAASLAPVVIACGAIYLALFAAVGWLRIRNGRCPQCGFEPDAQHCPRCRST